MLLPTADRLTFRPMTDDDLDAMAGMLGDPEVMTYYPRPKTRAEVRAWIDWNKRNYEEHGYGLWILESADGSFVGDCGLTWQLVNGRPELEVGYHVALAAQGLGYGTEAAAACLTYARDVIRAAHLVAIIHPDNIASRRVAETIGLRYEEDDRGGSIAVRSVFGARI